MKKSLIALSGIAVLSFGVGWAATLPVKPSDKTAPKINKGKCPLCFSNEQKVEVKAKPDGGITPKLADSKKANKKIK